MDGFLIVLLVLCLMPALHLLLKRFVPWSLEWAGGLMVRRSLKAHLPESYYRRFDDIWLSTPPWNRSRGSSPGFLLWRFYHRYAA